MSHGEEFLIERFWSKVDVRGPDDCWLWQGATNTDGYGRFNIYCLVKHQKLVQAHRFVYELIVDSIDESVHVLHRCDQPRCCNPKHLFVGTHSDNMKDMYSKNRHRRDCCRFRRQFRGGKKNPAMQEQ